MRRAIITLILVIPLISVAQPREPFSDKVRKAFSLVGRWEIVRMEVNRSERVTNPNTVPEASLAEANVVVKSDLGSYGHFTVAPGGSINGEGEVVFQYRVAAGSSAFSMGPVPLAIGAVAMLNNDNGVRKFTFTGNADLANRTIKLNVFEPQGAPLQMIIRPGGRTFTSVLWPPMTNIAATKVIVNGSSLLMRASGDLQGIKVYFEAVKYVDLAGLFNELDTYIDDRVTYVINRGGNVTNNPTTNNNNNNNTTNNTTNESGGTLNIAAGNVNVPMNGTISVTFTVRRADSNYAISLTPIKTDTPIEVSYSEKTATGFKVHVKGTGSGSVKVDWMVAGYNR